MHESDIIHFVFTNYIAIMVVVEFTCIYWEGIVCGGYI